MLIRQTDDPVVDILIRQRMNPVEPFVVDVPRAKRTLGTRAALDEAEAVRE